MGDEIVLGFHACVDYELRWNREKFEEQILRCNILPEELEIPEEYDIQSEREVLIACLFHMKNGTGAEYMPKTSDICASFANHFDYEITVGGTAARVAMAIDKIGYESSLSMVCFNQYIKDRLSPGVHYFSNVGEGHDEVYPHVIFSYPAGVHIQTNGIDFVTPRENRVMFSRDKFSLEMPVSQDFAPRLKNAQVMLLSCFSEVLDAEILSDRMDDLNSLLQFLPSDAFLILEDGCYIKKDFRSFVHRALRSRLDAISMNEDEMQEYIGERIDIMNAGEVMKAVRRIYESIEIPLLIVHSSKWALAYGKSAEQMNQVLEGGINLAATRFQHGDGFGKKEFSETAALSGNPSCLQFVKELESLSDREICCIPCKDLSFVSNPIVVGLGDYFAGGLLPGLLNKQK